MFLMTEFFFVNDSDREGHVNVDCNLCLVHPQDGGAHLLAVDEANEHILSVWEWQKGEKGHKITETKVSLQ